jgi:hypothetical protein
MTTDRHIRTDSLPVTVLVPSFNRAHYLAQALDSILSQDPAPAEVIVIDDGSEDNTRAVAERFAPEVQYLHQSNSGKAAALNLGLANAKQDLIWVCDDDDIAAAGTLPALYDALQADPEAGYAYGLCDKFVGEWPARERERNLAYQAGDRRALYVRLLEDFFLWQGAMLVRRSCYDAVGPFDTRLARSQDYEMALRLTRRFRGVGVPIVAFHQRHHEGMRGPKSAAIKPADVNKAWRKYNHLIFREIHAGHELAEFHATAAGPLDSRDTLTALIQRGSIMACKGLWDLATADFEAAAAQAASLKVGQLNEQEKAALRRIFQRGAHSLFETSQQAANFFRAVQRFPRQLRPAIKGNLLLPLTFRLRRIANAPFPRFELHQLWLSLRHLAERAALPHYLDARRTDHGMFGVRPLIAP